MVEKVPIPLKARNASRVAKIVHRGMDKIERASKDFDSGAINTPKFWDVWDRWDETGKAAMKLLSATDQQVVIQSRQTLHITGFPKTRRPRKK